MGNSSSSYHVGADAPVRKPILLHGRLEFHIDRAEGLPDTDTSLVTNLLDCFRKQKDVTDPFVTAEMGPVWLFETKYILNDLNPTWDEKFNIPVCQESGQITINVKDSDSIGSDYIASTYFSCAEIVKGNKMEDLYELKTKKGEVRGKIKLSIQFFPKDESDRLGKEVIDAYFPMRQNNRLTLYQDADTPSVKQVNENNAFFN